MVLIKSHGQPAARTCDVPQDKDPNSVTLPTEPRASSQSLCETMQDSRNYRFDSQ